MDDLEPGEPEPERPESLENTGKIKDVSVAQQDRASAS